MYNIDNKMIIKYQFVENSSKQNNAFEFTRMLSEKYYDSFFNCTTFNSEYFVDI